MTGAGSGPATAVRARRSRRRPRNRRGRALAGSGGTAASSCGAWAAPTRTATSPCGPRERRSSASSGSSRSCSCRCAWPRRSSGPTRSPGASPSRWPGSRRATARPRRCASLTVTALTMSPLQTAIVLFPASLYGEGLRRAFLQLSPRASGQVHRLAAAASRCCRSSRSPRCSCSRCWPPGRSSPRSTSPAAASLVLGVVIAFHVTFVLLWIALLLIYRLVGAGRIGVRALVLGSFAAGSVVAGLPAGLPAVPRDPRRLVAALRGPAGVRRRRRARPVALPHPRARARRLPAHPDPRRALAAGSA